MTKNLKVAFLGMSHLGIVSAIALATKSIQCIGIDTNPKIIDELNSKVWPIQEPGIEQSFKLTEGRLTFSSDITKLKECEIVYISQDVPTDDFGNSDLVGIEKLIEIANQNIPLDSRIVILCQVPPGFTRKMKKYHANISYQVETLVFGDAFYRAINPERIIVGLEDPNVSIDTGYNSILECFSCPIIFVDYESAEFTKISINAFLAASIITTNSLNEIANKVGADWNSIKRSLQLDRRIGEYAYLKPGLGISGGNIERDLKTLDVLAHYYTSIEVSLFQTILNFSQEQKNWIFKVISEKLLNHDQNAKIGILGISYKENTDSTKNSIALMVVEKFTKNIIGAYDPISVFPKEYSSIKIFSTAYECIMASDIVVIVTPWQEFSNLDLNTLPKDKKETIIILDPYSILKVDNLENNMKIIKLVKN